MKCFYPRIIHCKDGHSYEVPCNKCPACRKRKQSEWTLRMDFERRYGDWKHCYFGTLTYDPSSVPTMEYIDTDTGEVTIENVLNLDHHRGFWKRYRRYSGDKCMYFTCGEYGDKFDRPHLHFVLYTNLPWKKCLDEVKHAWSYSVPADTPCGYGVYECKGRYLTKRKLFGLVTLSSINMRRMRYCAKYIVKDNNSSKLVPKFARVSRGLGKCALTWCRELHDINKKQLSTLVYTSDCKPVSLPRYFRKRLFTREELDYISLEQIKRDSCPFPPINLLECFEREAEREINWFIVKWRQEEEQRKICLLSRVNLFAYS